MKSVLPLLAGDRIYTHQQARNGDRYVFAGRRRVIPAALAVQFNPMSRAGRERQKICDSQSASQRLD